MKLISLSDFVRIAEYPNNQEEAQSELVLIENFYKKVTQYNRFLKQPLELWMFVPCGENGNVLEEPVNYSAFEVGMSGTDFRFNFIDCQEYQQAKERVLFDGFYMKDGIVFTPQKQVLVSKAQLNRLTIENLVNYDYELTPTAQKQILC